MATQSRAPTSDEAVSGSWTGTAGSRYTAVDDYPDSGGSDFLTHGTTAGNLTFGFTAFSIPAGSSSISVSVLYYDRKNAGQTCNIGGRIKVGGTYYNASTHNPNNGSWIARQDDWATNPKSGVAWTVDDINGVGSNALQAVGWVSTDANPAIDLSSIELLVTYTPPSNSAYISFAEFEVPNAPRQLRASFAEFEVPSAPRQLQVSWTETEVPTAPRQLQVSWAETELPDAPVADRQLQVSWAETELPDAPAADRGLVVAWAETEAPAAPRQLQVSWAETETPNAPRGLQVAWAEMEIPVAPRLIQVSWAEAEVPNSALSNRFVIIAWAELETLEALIATTVALRVQAGTVGERLHGVTEVVDAP